ALTPHTGRPVPAGSAPAGPASHSGKGRPPFTAVVPHIFRFIPGLSRGRPGRRSATAAGCCDAPPGRGPPPAARGSRAPAAVNRREKGIAPPLLSDGLPAV